MTKFFKSFMLIVLAGTLLAACGPHALATPVPGTPSVDNPYSPQPGDETMMRGDAEIVSAYVLIAESLPPQISVSISYRLPTPCYQMRTSIGEPDTQNRIHLEIYGRGTQGQALQPDGTPHPA